MSKCSDCGFVYALVNDRVDIPAELSVDLRQRDWSSGLPGVLRSFPKCALMREEVGEGRTLQLEHECPEWINFIPGLSLPDYYRIKQGRELTAREDSRDAELQRREDRRDGVQRDREDKRDGREMRFRIFEFILVIVTIGAILAASLIPRISDDSDSNHVSDESTPTGQE